MTYTAKQLKQAFWNTFHKQGELYFDHLGTDEECENSTQREWNDFTEELEKISGENDATDENQES